MQAVKVPELNPCQYGINPSQTIAALKDAPRSLIVTYNALSLHADPTGNCWPSRARLSGITGLTLSTISKATTALQRLGLVRKRQTQHRTYYLLSRPAEIQECPPGHPEQTNNSKAKSRVHGTVFSKNPTKTTIEPPPATPEPPPPLQNLKTPPPDCIPEDWFEQARQLRPDIPLVQLTTTAAVFLDHYRAKGTLLKKWRYAWLGWVRKERVRKGPKSAPAPANTGRAIPLSPEAKANLDARTAAIDAHSRAQHEARLSGYLASIPAQPNKPLRAADARLETDERHRQARIGMEQQRDAARLARWAAQAAELGVPLPANCQIYPAPIHEAAG